jgi:hypothetical protein
LVAPRPAKLLSNFRGFFSSIPPVRARASIA